MINNTLTYISLFSSAGVGCYGFKQEGFECVATNEIIVTLAKRRIPCSSWRPALEKCFPFA